MDDGVYPSHQQTLCDVTVRYKYKQPAYIRLLMSTPARLYAYYCVHGIIWRMRLVGIVMVANIYCISVKRAYEEISNPHPIASADIPPKRRFRHIKYNRCNSKSGQIYKYKIRMTQVPRKKLDMF